MTRLPNRALLLDRLEQGLRTASRRSEPLTVMVLDLDRFKQDMDSPEVQEKVEFDQRRGAGIGVKTTPTVFLNNEAVPPMEANPDNLPAVIEAAVKKAKPSS